MAKYQTWPRVNYRGELHCPNGAVLSLGRREPVEFDGLRAQFAPFDQFEVHFVRITWPLGNADAEVEYVS